MSSLQEKTDGLICGHSIVAVKVFTWLSDVWLNNTNMMVWSTKVLRDVVLISIVMIVWESRVEMIEA